MDATTILSKIEARLGFVPPFFSAAAAHPQALENLWRQTELAYLDNPLPGLFKEKLAALLGRYCEVPYCLLCHTCSLRPLGMSGTDIVALLTLRHPSEEHVTAALARLDKYQTTFDLFSLSESLEQELFSLTSAVYFAGPLAAASRARLRERLSAKDYANLIVFTSYNKMCHEWVGAYPEISHELDQRYVANYEPLAAQEPKLVEVITELTSSALGRNAQQLEAILSERAAETPSAIAISERRFVDLVSNLKQRVSSALETVSATNKLAHELQRTADFAQELIAIVSHDLRTPLSNVLTGAELIRQLEPDNAKIARPLRRMVSSARRAERLIYDLLDFSQARAGGGIPIHRRPTDLAEIVQRAADDVELSHPGRTITVQLDGDGRGEWDADRLAQVLSNLLGNAVSHGLETAPIAVATCGDETSVLITVRNVNKVGPIPAETLLVLFDPFKRGVTHAISSTRSIGLGLYIVHEIVRGHDGHIEVSSDATDTTFSVRLPRTGGCASAK